MVGAIGGSEPSESLKVSFPLNTDGRYHAKIVDLSTLSGWTGSVGGIQLRFFESANSGDVMYLDSVILCGSLAKANAAAQARETVKAALGIYDEGTAALGHAEGANYVCNFDSTADLQYVANGNNSAFAYDSAYNALKCTATGADPSVYVNLSKDGVSADVYKYIVYTYRIPTASAVQNPVGNFYYVCGNITVPTAGYESALYPYAKDGDLHYAVIDLSTKANWTGNVKGLRIDYFNEAPSGSIVYIDSVIFCTTADAATAAGNRKLTGTDIHYLGTLENGNYLCNFDSSEDMQHIIGANNSLFSYDSAQNAMKCTVTAASDPNVYVDLKNEGISADVYKYMVCTYKIPTTTQRQNPVGNFYYVCGNITGPTAGYESSVYSYTKDGNLHYKVVDLSAKSNWSGQIKGMRIDYFTDAFIGDIAYIDSLVFCKTETDAIAAGNTEIDYTPPVLNPNDAAAVWNKFWQTGTISGNEFIVRSGDSGTDLNLYFRYNSTSALTQSSIADRFEKAIKTATGVDLSAEVYTGFIDIKNAFKTVTNGNSTSGNMQFTLTPTNGAAYCVRVPVTVILDAACPSDLNGNDQTEPDPTYPNLSQPSALGVTVTDSKASLTSANELAIHSNHEMRVVHTENKTFAVYPTGANTNPTQFEIFEIKADGSAASFYTDSMKRGSSKPNIMLGFDGMVYVFYGEEINGSAQLNAYYFNPATTTYTVTKVSVTKSFSGGNAAGGYGYSQPILDNTTKKAHVIFCGGQNGTGDFAWFSFDQQTKTWENNARHISIGNRHCYVYAYADQKGGVNLVAGRDVRLADIGLAAIVTGAEYAWDELSLFHIPDMYASSYTKSTFAPADYTQTGRSLYPTIQNNTWGDTYLASDGKLHILYQKSMHGTFHHDNKYKEIWHAVYDTAVTGTPQLIYNRPIRFVNEENSYACRLAESTAGDLYILAMPSNMNARVEIWSSADTNDFTFRFDSAKTFSTAEASGHSILITGPRNGSVKDNILDCMYPTGSGTATYRYFKVTLP